MNSLTELNGYASSLELPYTDLRSPTVLFQTNDATNQSQTVDEGFPFLSSVGIEITEIINPAISAPTYTIDVSSIPGTTVSWTSLPSGITLTNPNPGVYVLSGMTTKAQWDLIKQASITTPVNYFGLWSYTSSINYYSGIDGNSQKIWATAVTVNDIQFLSNPLQYVYAINTTSTIENTPQIINVDAGYPGVTWTVVGTPSSTASIDTWYSTGSGGTFSVNATTKVFTITGTRTQVNSRLAGLQIDSNSSNIDFALTYVCSNSLNSTTDTKAQLLSSVGLLYLGPVTEAAVYFIEDAASATITGAPVITDSFYDGSGGYVYTITPSNINAITNMTSIGVGGTSSFNPTTKILTISGTRSQINGRLNALSMTTSVDWATDFNLTYNVQTPRYDSATKVQLALCGSNDTEISNMNISRTYIANNANSIFAFNTPQITDFDTSESTYTISLSVSSSLGYFSFSTNDIPVNSLSFTGTRAQCNAKLASVYFWPLANVSSNGAFTYTQLKNSVQQLSQSVVLLGSSGSFSNPRTVTIKTGQLWTPDIGDVLYGKVATILLIGGGGGGGGGTINGSQRNGGQGGHGGGVLYSAIPFELSNQVYTINIGVGGSGGTSGDVFTGGNAGGTGGTTSGFGFSIIGGGGGNGARSGQSVNLKSGPGIGAAYQDDTGYSGSYSTATNSTGGVNRGGGGGHYSINGTGGLSPTSTTGGRGQFGFDEPSGSNSYWGAGGGGGGYVNGGTGGSSVAGKGASNTYPATSFYQGAGDPLAYQGGGGGGGGGFAAYNGADGNSGSIRLKIVAK